MFCRASGGCLHEDQSHGWEGVGHWGIEWSWVDVLKHLDCSNSSEPLRPAKWTIPSCEKISTSYLLEGHAEISALFDNIHPLQYLSLFTLPFNREITRVKSQHNMVTQMLSLLIDETDYIPKGLQDLSNIYTRRSETMYRTGFWEYWINRGRT